MESTRLDVSMGEGKDHLAVAVAYVHRGPRELSTTLTYTPDYLAHPRSFSLEPGLPLVSGAQHVRGIPRSFADSAPDRWGRNLVERAHRLSHRGESLRGLDDLDFLLGVSDATRHGALRFQVAGEYRAVGHTPPPQLSLERLLEASRIVDTDGGSQAVADLVDAGSHSLGGARPKASIHLPDGELGLAKFPRSADATPVMALEALAHDVAEAMGITTVWRDLVRVADQDVLVLKRFDRSGSTRIPYLSAMTLLGKADHESADYVELAGAVRSSSAQPKAALAELFDRVLHSVVLRNTDDHLRNHGFLRAPSGWVPSPVFDVNPTWEGSASRATSIAGAVTPQDEPEGLLELASHCALDAEAARARIERALEVTQDVGAMAVKRGLDRSTTGHLVEMVRERQGALTTALRNTPRVLPMAVTRTGGTLRVAPGHPKAGQFARKPAESAARQTLSV